MKRLRNVIYILFVSLALAGCKKLLQVNYPAGTLPSSEILGSDTSTIGVVTGVYYWMSGGSGSSIDGPYCLYLEMGLAADELDVDYSDPTLSTVYIDAFSPAEPYFWDFLYTQIYSCNAVIDSWPAAQAGTAAPLRRQAIGEAYFLRAFFLLYATNLYGAIPIPTTTDYRTNNTLSRKPQPDVYAQIISDLGMARDLLSSDYRDGTGASTTSRVRPNKWAALALLARANLYAGNWANAQAAADSVIAEGTQYMLPTDLNQVFLANSSEAIWQIAPVIEETDTYAASEFILDGAPNFIQPVAMSPFLVNAFESGDLRLTKWVGQVHVTTQDSTVTYYYPYKYKVAYSTQPQEYLMVMRLGEQFLIRAEALARQGDLADAAADLNLLRSRAGLPATTASTQSQLLTAIAHERQVELFTEFGDRWFDLKRTGMLDSVMQHVEPHKGGVWNSYDSLLPIPASEIQLNPNLTQNPGY